MLLALVSLFIRIVEASGLELPIEERPDNDEQEQYGYRRPPIQIIRMVPRVFPSNPAVLSAQAIPISPKVPSEMRMVPMAPTKPNLATRSSSILRAQTAQ